VSLTPTGWLMGETLDNPPRCNLRPKLKDAFLEARITGPVSR
jgi:hypothetical protein